MSDVMSYIVVPLAIGAVAVVLLLGLLNFTRGGSPYVSQRLMRWRRNSNLRRGRRMYSCCNDPPSDAA